MLLSNRHVGWLSKRKALRPIYEVEAPECCYTSYSMERQKALSNPIRLCGGHRLRVARLARSLHPVGVPDESDSHRDDEGNSGSEDSAAKNEEHGEEDDVLGNDEGDDLGTELRNRLVSRVDVLDNVRDALTDRRLLDEDIGSHTFIVADTHCKRNMRLRLVLHSEPDTQNQSRDHRGQPSDDAEQRESQSASTMRASPAVHKAADGNASADEQEETKHQKHSNEHQFRLRTHRLLRCRLVVAGWRDAHVPSIATNARCWRASCSKSRQH